MIRVLGIDPGLASTGYGVIECTGARIRTIDYGVIQTPAGHSVGARLHMLYGRITAVIEFSGATGAGIESLFFTRNITSALPVAQARGVLLLALEQHGIPAGEYPPQMIKQAVTGAGQADKAQVQEMVRMILGMPEIPRPDHAADALAAAITHYHNGQVSHVSQSDR